MRTKLMTSAVAVLGVLAFATVTEAQSARGGGGHDNGGDEQCCGVEDSYNSNSGNDNSTNDSFNDNSKIETDLEVDIEDSFNDNRDYDDSFNDNREYDTEVDIEDSFNDNREYDTEVEIEDSFNDNRDYSTEIEDSFNDNRDYDDSFNTDNSRTNLDLRLSLNLQELSANVSNLSFDMSKGGAPGDQNARLRTGDINQQGGAFAGFAGIQTVSNNTGLASIGQAATAVSANANVTFGGSGN